MRQAMADRWIEAAEARKVCEWVFAEQLPRRPSAAPTLLSKLCERLVLEVAQLRLALVSARPAA